MTFFYACKEDRMPISDMVLLNTLLKAQNEVPSLANKYMQSKYDNPIINECCFINSLERTDVYRNQLDYTVTMAVSRNNIVKTYEDIVKTDYVFNIRK